MTSQSVVVNRLRHCVRTAPGVNARLRKWMSEHVCCVSNKNTFVSRPHPVFWMMVAPAYHKRKWKAYFQRLKRSATEWILRVNRYSTIANFLDFFQMLMVVNSCRVPFYCASQHMCGCMMERATFLADGSNSRVISPNFQMVPEPWKKYISSVNSTWRNLRCSPDRPLSAGAVAASPRKICSSTDFWRLLWSWFFEQSGCEFLDFP